MDCRLDLYVYDDLHEVTTLRLERRINHLHVIELELIIDDSVMSCVTLREHELKQFIESLQFMYDRTFEDWQLEEHQL